MQTMAVAIGVMLMLASLWLLLKPGLSVELGQQLLGGRWRYAAALLRLLIGVVFLAVAASSRYPVAIGVLGWLFVFGALLLVVLPPAPLASLVRMVASAPNWLARLLSPLVFLFGAFIFYSFT